MNLTDNQYALLEKIGQTRVLVLSIGEGTTLRSLISRDLVIGTYYPRVDRHNPGRFVGRLSNLGKSQLKYRNMPS